MTASSRFGEFELDRSRFELLHKRDNSRMVDKPECDLKAAENDCLERRNSIRPCVPSHVAYKAERGR